jgi:hypothetical protein
MRFRRVGGPADAIEFAEEIADLSAVELEDLCGLNVEVGVGFVAGCPSVRACGESSDGLVGLHDLVLAIVLTVAVVVSFVGRVAG